LGILSGIPAETDQAKDEGGAAHKSFAMMVLEERVELSCPVNGAGF
jgi:hypothetical protein